MISYPTSLLTVFKDHNEQPYKPTVLRNMAPIRRKWFPPFSFMHFIAWLIPWSWLRDSKACSQVSKETSGYAESATLDDQTDNCLSVIDTDLEYLTREEAEQIIDRFNNVPQSSDRLLFWTGIPREWAQQWADDHGMLTLTSVMGPLMDNTDQRCLRRDKELEEWSQYVKGASGIFARYACRRGIVRVLTLPPSWAEFIRPESTYRTIEEPVLKGTSGCYCAVQINTVHLLATPQELEYQTWPENRIPKRLKCGGVIGLNFRLPRWAPKAVEAVAKSLRSNVVSFTAPSTPKPVVQRPGSLARKTSQNRSERQGTFPASKKCGTQQTLCQVGDSTMKAYVKDTEAGEPRTAKQPKSDKQLQSDANAQISQQPQSKDPQSKTQQPQSQQLQSKKQSPQIQQPQSKNQQSQSQQPQRKKKQPQTQQSLSKKQQPQTQQLSSGKGQPKPQQLPSKKEQPQKQKTQNQQPQTKKPQPQNHKQPQQGRQPQSSESLIIKAGPYLRK
jgi:hypothetical protein